MLFMCITYAHQLNVLHSAFSKGILLYLHTLSIAGGNCCVQAIFLWNILTKFIIDQHYKTKLKLRYFPLAF